MAGKQETLFDEQIMKDIAAKYGKHQAQIALRWAIQRGLNVIPHTTKP